jgi:hypothetical protein
VKNQLFIKKFTHESSGSDLFIVTLPTDMQSVIQSSQIIRKAENG